MNIRKLSLWSSAASLLLAAAACSEKNMPDDPSNPISDGDHLMTFQIMNASESTGTRAEPEVPEGEGEFVSGTANESKIENVILVFFGDDGKFFTAKEPDFRETTPSEGIHTQEGVLEAQVSLRTINQKKPKYVLAIINGKGLEYDTVHPGLTLGEVNLSLQKPTKDEMLKAIGKFDVALDDKGEGPAQPLMMTNSSYIKTSEGVETKIDIQEIPDDAFISADDPRIKYNEDGSRDLSAFPTVHIDVERVNARVEINTEVLESNIQDSEFKLGEDTKKVKPRILGIQIGQMPRVSYLVKSLEGCDSYDVINWKSELYPRSYWATCPSLVAWNTQDPVTKEFLDSKGDYKYLSYNEMKGKNILLSYPHENTTEHPVCVVVAAVLEDEDGNPIQDMIDITGTRKYFYTMDGYRAIVATELQKRGEKFTYINDKGENTVSGDWAPFIELRRTQNPDDQSFHVKPYVVPDEKKISAQRAAQVNEILSTFDPVLYYKDGMCYFYVEIQHDLFISNPDKTEGAAEYIRANGVVRNHAYEVILKSLKGIGSPVYDPDEEIIPNRPDEILELQAEIHPLKWKHVKQEADLK